MARSWRVYCYGCSGSGALRQRRQSCPWSPPPGLHRRAPSRTSPGRSSPRFDCSLLFIAREVLIPNDAHTAMHFMARGLIGFLLVPSFVSAALIAPLPVRRRALISASVAKDSKDGSSAEDWGLTALAASVAATEGVLRATGVVPEEDNRESVELVTETSRDTVFLVGGAAFLLQLAVGLVKATVTVGVAGPALKAVGVSTSVIASMVPDEETRARNRALRLAREERRALVEGSAEKARLAQVKRRALQLGASDACLVEANVDDACLAGDRRGRRLTRRAKLARGLCLGGVIGATAPVAMRLALTASRRQVLLGGGLLATMSITRFVRSVGQGYA